MANRDLTSSVGKGSSINQAEHDQNMNGLNGTCEEVIGATFTIDYQDHGKTLQFNRGTAIAVTLGTAASIGAAMDTGIDNFLIYLKNIGAGVVTVTSTDNIDGDLTLVLNQYESALIQTNDDNTSWNVIAKDIFFPSGTRMLFQQTAAPAGWTKDTTDTDERALRVVSGNVGNGGDTNFTTVFTATTATTAESSHTHDDGTLAAAASSSPTAVASGGGALPSADGHTHTVSGTTGAGSSHSHTSDLNVYYLDVIVAEKD